MRKADGTVLATINVPNTGGYQAWQTVSATVSLTAGPQTIRIISTGGAGWNINWLDIIAGSAAPPPPVASTIHIEAENYAAMSGVVKEPTSDTGGGEDVGWIDYTDWMDYNVIVSATGKYTARFRVASPNSTAQLELRKADGTVLATINLPNTGGYQTWQTVAATISLPSGQQTLRVISTGGGGWNFNWMEFVPSAIANLLAGRTLFADEPGKALSIDKLFTDGSTLFAVIGSKRKEGVVSIISMSGAVLTRQVMPLALRTDLSLPVSGLPKGDYFLSVTTADGGHAVKKFAKLN
jgi:endoglucanase